MSSVIRPVICSSAMALLSNESADAKTKRGKPKNLWGEVRAKDQKNNYRKIVPVAGSLKKRLEALAKLRSAEGYMAEVIKEKPGTYLLIEHHCPICEAAKSCQELCAAELDVFKSVLGRGVRIERCKHLLSNSDRCVYRIQDA